MPLTFTFNRIAACEAGTRAEIPSPDARADVAVHELAAADPVELVWPAGQEDALLVHVQLSDLSRYRCRLHSAVVDLGEMRAGSAVLHASSEEPILVADGPFRAILLIISQRLLRRAGALRSSRRGAPRTEVVVSDRILHDLSTCLLAELAPGAGGDPRLAEYLLLAVAVRITSAFSGEPRTAPFQGGLAPWQLRRAQHLLASDLAGRIELAVVAQECGLSVSHFSRSFRQSVGQAPHSWLIGRRLDTAKSMLRRGSQSLAEVALSCGFADQSHLTRVFTREVGVSPGAWRRTVGTVPIRAIA